MHYFAMPNRLLHVFGAVLWWIRVSKDKKMEEQPTTNEQSEVIQDPHQHYWFAVYTKPRNEKKVQERLERDGIEAYCPVRISQRKWSDRVKKIKEPLFTSYVFVRVNEYERIKVLEDPGTIQYVYWLGKPAIIRDEEIEAIKIFLREFPDAEAAAIPREAIRQGDEMKIVGGAFDGQKGIVREHKNDDISLYLPSIGMVVKVSSEYLAKPR